MLKQLNLENEIVLSGTELFKPIEEEGDDKNKSTQRIKEFHFCKELIKWNERIKSYTSEIEGIAILEKDEYSIIKIKDEGFFNIKVADSNMTAYLSILPPRNGKLDITVDDIKSKLKKEKITYGILPHNIENAVEECSRKMVAVRNIKIAQGTMKTDGIDAEIDYLINTKADYAPQLNQYGRIDFHQINLIESVLKDQKLAVYHPHKEGKNGRDVFGNVIEAKVAKKITFPAGLNTYFNENDSNTLYAKESGSVVINGGKINVSKIFTVENVGYSTGDIKFEGTVRIKGDVQNGFKVIAGGNVDVSGCVEDAIIESKGSVAIKHGFNGSGKGIINAVNSVQIKFIKEQKIYCRGLVEIQNEALNASLYAKDEIHVGGKNISLVGGYAIAGKKIEAENIGNEYNVHTTVEVGYDYKSLDVISEKKEELKINEKKLSEIKQNLEKCQNLMKFKQSQIDSLNVLIDNKVNSILRYKKMMDTSNEKKKIDDAIIKLMDLCQLNGEQKTKFKKVIDNISEIAVEIEHLKSDLEKLNNLIYKPSKACIIVHKNIYPGTVLIINKVKRIIRKKMVNKKFVLSAEDEEIIAV